MTDKTKEDKQIEAVRNAAAEKVKALQERKRIRERNRAILDASLALVRAVRARDWTVVADRAGYVVDRVSKINGEVG